MHDPLHHAHPDLQLRRYFLNALTLLPGLPDFLFYCWRVPKSVGCSRRHWNLHHQFGDFQLKGRAKACTFCHADPLDALSEV